MNLNSDLSPVLSPAFFNPPAGREASWLAGLIKQKGEVRVVVTPALAKEMLVYNTHNRKLREARVQILAVDHVADKFIYNAAPVSFDTLGRMVDGAHRTHMCISTGKPFKALLAFGLDPEAQMTVDAQAPRSAADVVSLSLGFPHANEVTAAAGFLYEWDTKGTIPTNTGYRASRNQKVGHAEKVGSIILDALASLPASIATVISRSNAAACYVKFLEKTPREDVQRFFDHLATGANLEDGDPILVARNTLTGFRDRRRRGASYNHRTAPFEVVTQAWNKWRRGDKAYRNFTLTGTIPAVEK